MDQDNERSHEEDLADLLWGAITAIQGITDRLLAQYERSVRGPGDETDVLASLTAG